MSKQQSIMVIGAGLLQVPAIETAKDMGLKAIVTDYNKNAPGMQIADVPIVISTRDIEGTVRSARRYIEKGRIDGVITVGTDASMTVAAVANALNLPGIKFEAAENATNKIKMRSRFKKFNVPSPDFSECWTVEEAFEFAKKHEFPLVIKPSDNMGARGVIRINDFSEIQKCFEHAKQASPSGELIIEEYMDGMELSIDALVFNNKVVITGIADRMIGFDPYFVEMGHIMPSNLPEARQKAAVNVFKKGIKALGITLGSAKGDIKLTTKGPMIGEIAARLSGGFMSAYTYPYSTGINLLKAAIKIALGLSPSASELKPKYKKVSVEKAIIPQAGSIVSISGVDKAKKIPGIKQVFLRVKRNDIIKQPTNNLEKAGNVIGVAKTRKEALKIVDDAINEIKIEVGPVPMVTEKEIFTRAQKLFDGSCLACSICDGVACRGMLPGMGSVGSGQTFINNIEAFKRHQINLSVIHNILEPDLSAKLLGYKINIPVIAAPITGTDINMNDAIDEYEYAEIVVDSFRSKGSFAMVGDGARSDMYLIGLRAIKQAKGWGIPIFKPRLNIDDIIKRIRVAEEYGAIGVGIDIDAVVFKTLKMENQATGPLDMDKLKKMIRRTKIPFILKGIMTKEEALKALDAGAKGIVVSNHGGRVLDSMPASLDVLEEIAGVVKNKMTIFIDGGVRTGLDVFKCLALGADAVLIGRPVTIYAVGGGIEGVKFYMDKIREELRDTMILTGAKNIKSIKRSMLRRTM